jgi:hypothetical protein
MYHSYNAIDFEYIGRQAMLDELVWDEATGWPRFKNGNTPSVRAEMPFANTTQVRDSVYSEDFSGNKNLMLWQWDLNHPKPGIEIRNGQMNLSANQEGLTFAGLNPKIGTYSFEAELNRQTVVTSGIGIYGNAKNLLVFAASDSKLVIFFLKNGTRETLAEVAIPEKAQVSLKMNAVHGRFYQFFYTTDQKNWLPVKFGNEFTVDGNFLPQWGVAMRTGLFIDGKVGNTVVFDSVKMSYKF